MNENAIQFFTEDISYQIRGKRILRGGIVEIISDKGFKPGPVNIIFCSDRYLKRYNAKYLGHHYYTDVIAFNLSERKNEISGDIYLSLDRVRENAKKFKVPLRNEIARVILHGILHLTGMEDSTEEKKLAMKNEEDRFMSKIGIV